MHDDVPDTSPGGGRPVTLAHVLDEILATKSHVQELSLRVDTAIRPVRFPLAPLWVIAGSIALLALVGCYAVATPRAVISEPAQHAAAR